MKKKILTMVMVLTVVLSQSSAGFAGISGGLSSKINLSYLYAFLTNYICGSGGQTGGTDSAVPDKPQIPGQDDTAGDTVVNSHKKKQVLDIVNKERSAKGIAALKGDKSLDKVAQLKAEDMAKKGYFSHNSPTYGSAFDMLKKYNISYKTAGENIAKGQKTAQTVMDGWMNSQGHRANILNRNYTKLGVGYAVSADGTPYWVQIFIG